MKLKGIPLLVRKNHPSKLKEFWRDPIMVEDDGALGTMVQVT